MIDKKTIHLLKDELLFNYGCIIIACDDYKYYSDLLDYIYMD